MKIFISYCHEDHSYVDRLLQHLKQLDTNVDVWSDKRLKIGDEWQKEIDQALSTADAVIIFTSVGFLASDFIKRVELPAALESARLKKALILPLVVNPCRYTKSVLAGFQAANDPRKPLAAIQEHERDEIFSTLVDRIEEVVDAIEAERSKVPPTSDALKEQQNFEELQLDDLENPSSVLEYGIITQRRIYIPDLFRHSRGHPISGKTFSNCFLYGPAIIHLSNSVFTRCAFDIPGDHLDALLYEVQYQAFYGSYVFHQCNFFDCQIFGVGFCGNKDSITHYRSLLSSLKDGSEGA